jgi:hypothetical protein
MDERRVAAVGGGAGKALGVQALAELDLLLHDLGVGVGWVVQRC